MKKKRTGQFTIADLPESITTYKVKDFAIASREKRDEVIAFEHPFSFEGIIFAVCKKGYAKVKIDLEEYTIETNNLLTIFPNQLFEHIDGSEDFVIEMLVFTFDFLSDLKTSSNFRFFKSVAKNPLIKITDDDVENLLRYHEFIKEIFEKAKPEFLEQIIKGILYAFLAETASIYAGQSAVEKKKSSSRGEKMAEEFLLLLKENYKTERKASFYADKMFITPKYLSYTLKKVTGRSINVWLEDAILAETKILLKLTNLTSLQISEELNFPNPSYFGQFFKKCTGMTPKEYRDS
ncbi:MAG: helix-turn-helix domain-containing protein [Dysgonamonadaceae bacterium]|jgi:AraC-like DNA-binding protein|nr:helix-turn-helix domain-containing protein [Dysgonamonadaceae bacterium]